jgi:hypothetical protein
LFPLDPLPDFDKAKAANDTDAAPDHQVRIFLPFGPLPDFDKVKAANDTRADPDHQVCIHFFPFSPLPGVD